MNAFAYLRVSGRGQLDGDGFDRQEIACRAYADAHGITLTRIFQEKGVTGKKDLEDRPALIELLEALEETGTKTILIEKLDRLARDLMIQETILADLQKQGYTIISAAEPDLCTDDPSRKLMRQIFGAIAEYDRCMIVLKLRGARQRTKAREGRCEGRKPYGYYPGEEYTLTLIREMRTGSAFTTREIAASLNRRLLYARSGKPWTAPVIAKILSRNQLTQ